MLSFDRVISSTKKNKKLDEINMDTVKSLSNELKSGNEEAISNYLGKTNKIITKKNTSKEKDDSSKGFLQKGALSVFDDGYDIGDITKSILGGSAATVGDITLNVAKGAGNIVEGLADIVSYGVAGTADLIGKDDYAENVRKRTQVGLVDKFTKKADDYLDQYSFAGNLTDNISQGIGTVGSIILTGGLGSAAGLGTAGTTALTTGVMGASSMGSGMSEAYRSGATDGQAFAYGTIAGLAEAGTELLFGGLGKAVNAVGLSKGLLSLDDALAKKVSSKISNQITKNFAEYGIKAGAEGFEEVASGFMQALGKKATYMSEEELGKILEDENLLEQFVTGAITSGIAQSGYVPGMKQGSLQEANKTGRDFITGYTQNEQTVIDSLVNEQTNEIAKKNALENELNKAIESKETEQGGILSTKEKNALKSKIQAQIDSGEIDISSTKVSNKDISKIREAVEENMQKGLLDTNTIESVLGTDTDLSNDGYLQKSYIETAKKKEAFTYENKITDAKEKAVYESAAKYFNNTTRSHEFVERVAKISKDKGTNYGFINNDELQTLGHDVEGKQVNGLVRTNKNGEQTVLINVDSPKALETIVGHETTHLLEGTQEYKELQDAIFNYAKEKGDFDTRQKNLNSLYEGIENADIDSELTADLVGDYLFTDTDFINNLSTQKPTIFQKIKELIDDLVVRFTGTKEEKALREVQKKFKEAYKNTQKNINNEVKYSIQEDINGKYIKVDTDQDIFNGIAKNDYNKIAKMYINEYLRGTTVLSRNDSVKITSQTANKYTNPGVKQSFFEEKMKLSTELKNVLEIAEKIDESQPKKENAKYPNWEYYKVRFEINDRQFEAVLNIGVDNKGEKHFYELNKIKKVDDILAQKSPNRSSTSINNSITNLKEDVNTINNNYMLNNSNNTSKYSLNEEEILSGIYENVPHRTSKDNQKNNKRIEEYLESKYPDYHITFTNYKNDGEVVINLIETKQEFENRLKNYKNNNFKEIPRVEITPEDTINFKHDERPEYDSKEWNDLEDIRTRIETLTNELDKSGEFGDYGVDYEESHASLDATYIKLEDNEGETRTIRVANHNDSTGWSDYHLWLSDYKSKTELINDLKKLIYNVRNGKSEIKYSLTDNKGRELTQEQQEYFKDSKVRDENENLLTAYHGTEANAGIPKEYWFTTFDIDKSGRNGNMLGEGFYFTTSEEHAKQYAHTKGNVYEVYLDIKNPLELDYLNGGGLAYNIRKINPLIEADIYKRDGQIDGYKVRRYLLENGYDGIHVGDTWVAFNSNQIKSVENANPTAEDPNIFRSLSQQNETVSKNPNLTYGEDVKLQVEEAIAPLKEQINELTEQLINNTTDNVKVSENPNMEQIAPIQEETYLQEYLNNPTSKIIDGFDYSEHRTRIINKANNDIVNLIDKTSNENMVQVLQKAYEENEQSIGNKNPANGIYDGRHEDAVLEYQHKESMLSGFIRKLQGIYGKNNNIKDTEMYKLLKENQNTHKNLAINEFAPIPQDIVEQQNKEAFKNIDDSNMPSEVEDTTPDNEAKMTTSKSLFETRDYADVGNRKVNAYQYDNPEVKPYFQEAAQLMLYDLDNSIKGERIYNDEAYYNSNGEIGWQGTKRHTTEDIAELLDGVNGKYKLSREDIKKGLNAIINDEGAENNAASKRIEMYLDQRLRQGYTTVDGFEIPANQEYIDMMNTKTTNGEDIADYHNSIPITDDLAPVENVDNVSNSESIAPFKEKTTTENDNDVLDVPIQRKFDLENQVITDETISKLEKKKAREFKKLGAKEDYISNRALELYDEVKNLKQGTKASYELGRVLDVAFANIEEHTKGKTEAEAKKIKNAIWRRVTTSLLNVKAKPLTTVNVNSKVESAIRQNLNKEYDSKVDEINNLKEEKITLKNIHQGYIDTIKQNYAKKGFDFDKVLDNATKKSTLSSVDNTPQRFIEKTLGYKEGQILNDLTINQTALNESEGIKWLNSFTNRKDGEIARISKQYNIKPGSKESAAAQMYGEGFYVDEHENLVAYGDAELAKDFPDRKTQENIKKLAKNPRIRQIYDETLDSINKSRVRNGYPEIPRRNNYFLHFRAMEDTFSQLGLPFNPNDIKAKDLPTDMAAIDTASLRPGQPYFASANQRKGNKTSYDLLGGLERYLGSAKNQIYHIDDIQTLRALRNYVADKYGQAKGLEDLDSLSDVEAEERIKQVYNAHLSTFAKFLNEQANVLAGKTTLIDRGLEGIIGRRGITTLNTINSQVAKNMVGFNISSSLTNFTGAVQGFAKAENKFDAIKAFAQVTSNKINSIFGNTDGFVENDPTMIRRQGVEKFYRTPYEKVSDVGYGLMSAVDNITTEFLVRTKYNELTRKGMGDEQAHIEAGKWAMRILGDRSLGQQPQLYNSKMLGLFTKFQLEVRNQLDSMIYDTIQEANVNTEDIKNASERNAKKAAKITSTMVQLAVFQHLFGKAFESVAGYNPTFDIIETLMTALGFDDDEDSEDTPLDNIEQAFLGLLEDLPYTSTFTGGRIPIQSALPIEQFIKGEDDYGNEKSRIETFSEALPYYVLPGGYNQLKKTSQGLSMFDDDLPVSGSYTDSGNLRFPVEDTLGNRIQAGVFGQWANKNAQTYFDEKRTPLKEKQIQEYADLDLPIREYWDYRDGLKGLNTLEEKFEYINDLDVTEEQKNIMINNIVDRKEEVDISNYDDYESYEEFDFAIKNEDKYNFLQENNISYSEYVASDESKEAYNWAFKNPDSYSISKAVTDDVVIYRQYKNDIYDIAADKDENGDSIRGSRKEKIISYVNGLDLSIPQKAILIRQEYTSFNDYNNQIVEYVASLNISYEEKVKIIEGLDMTIGSDGRVYWK